MPIFAKAGATFTPAPAGTHAAICVDVIDHGMVELTWQGKTQSKHKISIAWQIAEDMENGKPFLVRRRYTLSLHEKASLRKDLESWRGRAFTSAELEAFDVENLLSVGCLLNIIHNETQSGATYANVAGVMRLPKGMQAPTPRDYVRVCDRPAAAADGAEVDGLDITDDDVPF